MKKLTNEREEILNLVNHILNFTDLPTRVDIKTLGFKSPNVTEHW